MACSRGGSTAILKVIVVVIGKPALGSEVVLVREVAMHNGARVQRYERAKDVRRGSDQQSDSHL